MQSPMPEIVILMGFMGVGQSSYRARTGPTSFSGAFERNARSVARPRPLPTGVSPEGDECHSRASRARCHRRVTLEGSTPRTFRGGMRMADGKRVGSAGAVPAEVCDMHLRPRSRLRAPSLVTFLFSALSMDCANGAIDTGGASLSGDSATVDSGSAPHDSAPVSHDAAHDSLGGVDDATIVSATFPDHLACDATNVTTVVVKNTGTTTWTKAAGYKLGGIGDSDPLHPGEARIWLG